MPYVIYYPTVMARYSLFVLKVPLNPNQTNKPQVFTTTVWMEDRSEKQFNECFQQCFDPAALSSLSIV